MSRSMPLAMAEAGAQRGLPRVRHPLRALRTIIADPSLQARVDVTGGST